jgi:hypothetical protein
MGSFDCRPSRSLVCQYIGRPAGEVAVSVLRPGGLPRSRSYKGSISSKAARPNLLHLVLRSSGYRQELKSKRRETKKQEIMVDDLEARRL